MSSPRVLIVVPTLGSRPELLRECLHSIAAQSVPADIVIVGPIGLPQLKAIALEFGAQLLADPGSLPAAINVGVRAATVHHEYVNWLGDDDVLEPGSLHATVSSLDGSITSVVAYGACRYIDENGSELWVSKAGKWAPRILKWGPDLIPQPGMLMRKSAWDLVGGVDENFRFAFDLDLLLKLQKIGSFVDVEQVVSSFRWHAGSLTVGDRQASLIESELARRRSLSPIAGKFVWIWERPVRLATVIAAREVSRRARRANLKTRND